MYLLQPYDDSLQLILDQGVWKDNRTGVRAKTIFGIMTRYRIDESFPLLTKRRIWPKAILAELLWFLSGSSNNKDLQALNSNIWTPWVDPEFAERNHFEESSLGPVYGFQLRHFGGYYGDGRTVQMHLGENIYGRGGVDQLEYVMEKLNNEPDSRRILWSLWNPKDLDKMRLAPCHYTFQLFVHDGRLSGMLTQRSADMLVGVPANVQFYSSLIYMLAQQCGFAPFEFVHSIANAHIYENQMEGCDEYLARPTPASPRLQLQKAKDIYSYTLDDFRLLDYNPEPNIKIPVAV